MKTRTVANITQAEELNMGGTIVKQTLPTQRVPNIDPFLLLHHFGPTDVKPGDDPLDVGPHPHRGFEPVTFLYSGGIKHRDSRGNTGILSSGDVQWMTAGMGIIHSERASEAFLEEGGNMEGIQLWVNLPKSAKMAQPRYQDIKASSIPEIVGEDGQSTIRVVAGTFQGHTGPAETHTPVVALQVKLEPGSRVEIPLPPTHNALAHILEGEVQLNDNWNYQGGQLLHFNPDGEGIVLAGGSTTAHVLVLSGEPLNEPIAQWGPYVMNTQTEIMEAMRDYQMGKMGFYVED